MRKIETQMNAAIQSNANWQSGNTAVYFDETSGVSVVRLHGNKIAEVSDDTMTIFDGGWQSTTTKSRLNALCEEFCIDGECVYQKNFQWYVDKFVGMAGQSKVFNTYLRFHQRIHLCLILTMLKKTLIRVVGETSNEIDSNLTRLEKFSVFCQVCDGMLKDGRITKAQHSSWTHIF